MKLLDKLNLIKGSLSNQEIVPILANFCFTGREVIAFDGIQASSINHDSGLFCGLPAQLLLKLLAGYKSALMTFEVKEDNVILKSGKSKTKLSSLPSSDFIFTSDENKIDGIKYEFDSDFIAGIKRCLVSVSDRDVSQMGITIVNSIDQTVLYSTNNNSISKYTLKQNFGDDDFKSFIPLKFCQQLILWDDTFKKSIVKEIIFGKDSIRANFDEGYLFTKLSVMEFLNFEDVIESATEEAPDVFEVPENLENILGRCMTISSSEKNSRVTISCAGDVMSFHAEGRYGDVREEVRLECEVKDSIFIVDSSLFDAMLPMITELSISDCGSNKVIIGRDKNYLNLLMSLLT